MLKRLLNIAGPSQRSVRNTQTRSQQKLVTVDVFKPDQTPGAQRTVPCAAQLDNPLAANEVAGLTTVRQGLPILLSTLLIGCSSLPLGSSVVLAQENRGDGSASQAAQDHSVHRASASMDSQLMFEIMIAEMAGRRGQLDVAMAGYLRASERTDDPRVSERATRLAVFGRQWKEAEKAARRWMQLDPDHTESGFLLAQILVQQGRLRPASDQYLRLLEQSDDWARSLAQIQLDLRQVDGASQSLSVLQAILDAYPNEILAHMAMVRAHLSAADRESALEAVNTALALQHDHTDALLLRGQVLSSMGRADEGLRGIETALQRTPQDTDLRLGYAQLLVDAGRFDAAADQLDQIYKADTDNDETLLTISLLALDSRRYQKASIYLTELKERGVYLDHANFYLGRISDQQQDYAKAIDFYDSVGEGDLRLPAQISAAELIARSGDLEQGRIRLRSLATANANPALQPRLIRAESQMLQQADQAFEAVKVLTEGLNRFPDHSDLLYSRALAADKAGDAAMMIDDLNRLIVLEPDNAHAFNALGYYYADNNIELEKAEELLETAIALDPTDPAIMDSVGWLRYRQGRFEEAIELLRAAYQLLPVAEIAAHLSEALWVSGDRGEATELLQQALLDDPDDEYLLKVKEKYIE